MSIIRTMELDDLPPLLTVAEAAAFLRIGRSAAYDLTQQWRATAGRTGIAVVSLGRCLRVPRSALAQLIALPLGPSYEHERSER
jgi:hypothetical protein